MKSKMVDKIVVFVFVLGLSVMVTTLCPGIGVWHYTAIMVFIVVGVVAIRETTRWAARAD